MIQRAAVVAKLHRGWGTSHLLSATGTGIRSHLIAGKLVRFLARDGRGHWETLVKVRFADDHRGDARVGLTTRYPSRRHARSCIRAPGLASFPAPCSAGSEFLPAGYGIERDRQLAAHLLRWGQSHPDGAANSPGASGDIDAQSIVVAATATNSTARRASSSGTSFPLIALAPAGVPSPTGLRWAIHQHGGWKLVIGAAF